MLFDVGYWIISAYCNCVASGSVGVVVCVCVMLCVCGSLDVKSVVFECDVIFFCRFLGTGVGLKGDVVVMGGFGGVLCVVDFFVFGLASVFRGVFERCVRHVLVCLEVCCLK